MCENYREHPLVYGSQTVTILHTQQQHTIDENNIGAPKMRSNVWGPIKFKIFRNIWLFPIAPHKVINLLTLR